MASSYWLNFEELWSTWPSRQITGELKWYFLVQLSFWLQQLLAINLEKRRKDYSQMFTHHVVTSLLMYIAYAYRWTKVGNVILVIMDVVDVLLPVCKRCSHALYHTCSVTKADARFEAGQVTQIFWVRNRMQHNVRGLPSNLARRSSRDLRLPLLVYLP